MKPSATSDSGTREVDESCPICLNDMSAPDTLHPIKCPTKCNFNFCINCLTSLLASSKDDYQMASDGNRHVKVHLNCPNCRANISGYIEETIRLRRKSLSDQLQKVPDSELSAKELQAKYWKDGDELLLEAEKEQHAKDLQQNRRSGVKPLEIDPTLFGGLQFAMSEQEQKYVTKLMTSGYPDQLCQAAQILAGIAELVRKGATPSQRRGSEGSNAANHPTVHTTNIHSSHTLHGRSNTAGIGPSRSRERETQVSEYQKQIEAAARDKLRRPLPARMPLSVTLSTAEFERMALQAKQMEEASHSQSLEEEEKSWWKGWFAGGADKIRGNATMAFVDDEWDGSVADAFARARIGNQTRSKNLQVVARAGPKNQVEQMGVKTILALGEEERKSQSSEDELNVSTRVHRVLVGSVRGQAGKSGIMKGDVVTHVNGEVFTGDAADLNAMLIRAFEEQGKEGVVTIVVNAEACTAEALRLRSRIR